MKITRIPITLVIVDAGPLISLAACERLDLLEVFERKVRITDVVRAECLRYPDRIGSILLTSWFENLEGIGYQLIDTPLLDDWEQAVEQEATGVNTRPSKGIGDASITWLIQQILATPIEDEEVLLLLSDDASFGDVVIARQHPEVYMLSTRVFLQVLQNFGVIESSTAVIAKIHAAGREMSRYEADRPGRIAPGTKSQWTDPLKEG